MRKFKLGTTRKKSVEPVSTGVLTTKSRNIINPIKIEDSNLDDLLKASRIIVARIKGLDDRKSLKRTQVVRKIVARAYGGKQEMVLSQINEAIVKKNQQTNKPTKSTKELYKRIIQES